MEASPNGIISPGVIKVFFQEYAKAIGVDRVIEVLGEVGINLLKVPTRLQELRKQLDAAGDRRDWEECNRLDAAIQECMLQESTNQ